MMKATSLPYLVVIVLLVVSCSSSEPIPSAPKDATPAVAPPVDRELEQLKTVKPVDACSLLSPEKLKAAFPGIDFSVHQKLEPRQSGYAWDSRCTYWAGVGSMEFAKDVPTHTIDIMVNTVVSAEKARANLKSREETASSTTGYLAQPSIGPSAYTITNTGTASLFFVKGESEIQMQLSELKSKNEEKVAKLTALAQSL